MCDREAEVICSCQVRLCRTCFTLHRLDYPQGRHIPTQLAVQSSLEQPVPQYTLDGIKLVRVIEKEEGHEIHEGVVLNSGASVVVSWKTFRSESDFKRYQLEAEKVAALRHRGLSVCLAHYLDDSYQEGYRYVLVFEAAEEGDLKSEMHTRLLTGRRLAEADLQAQLRLALSTFAYLQASGMAFTNLQLTDFIRIGNSVKFGMFCDLTENRVSLGSSSFKEQLRLSVRKLASLFLQLGHSSETYPGYDTKALRKSLFAMPCGPSLKTVLSLMLFSNLDFQEVGQSLAGVKVTESGLLSVQTGAGYHVSSVSPQLILCPKLQPSSSIAFLSPFKVMITGGAEKPTSVFKLNLQTCQLKQRPNLTQGRAWHSSLSFNSTVLVVGGRSQGISTASTEIELTGKVWTQAQALTTPREAASLTRYGKVLYLCGGLHVTETSHSYLSSIEIYNTAGWQTLDLKLTVGLAFCDILPLEGELLVLGGLTETQLSTDVWRLNSEDLFWTSTMPQGLCFRYARWGCAACALAVQTTLWLAEPWRRLELKACPI